MNEQKGKEIKNGQTFGNGRPLFSNKVVDSGRHHTSM